MSRGCVYIRSYQLSAKRLFKPTNTCFPPLSVEMIYCHDEERRHLPFFGCCCQCQSTTHRKPMDIRWNSARLQWRHPPQLRPCQSRSTTQLCLSKRQAEWKVERVIRILEIVKMKSVASKILLAWGALHFSSRRFSCFWWLFIFIIRFIPKKIKAGKIMNEQQHEIDQQKIRELEDNIRISSACNPWSHVHGTEEKERMPVRDLHVALGEQLEMPLLLTSQAAWGPNSTADTAQLDQCQHSYAGSWMPAVESKKYFPRPAARERKSWSLYLSHQKITIQSVRRWSVFRVGQYYNIDDKLDDMTALLHLPRIQGLIAAYHR